MANSGSRTSQRSGRGWRPYRSSHRAKSHRAVHEQATNGHPPPILEHPDVPAQSPDILETDAQLGELIATLRAAGSFGYDSEFIGEHTYHPSLCLIQVATKRQVALIDPLAALDLTPFWELIADPSVETVVHAGVPDLEPVVRHLGRMPANIFDTQIAAAFTGAHYPSALSRLIEPLLGADLGQGLKFSQWDQRPLSEAQIVYAANDVRYLPLLRDRIASQLTEADRLGWAAEECATLCDESLYRNDLRAAYARFRGPEAMSNRQQGVLIALIEWREGAAKEHDVPPRALIRDDVLAAVAREAPDDAAQLKRIRGLPRPVREMHGQEIIGAVGEAGKSNPFARPDFPHWRAEELKPAIDALLAAIRKRCDEQGVAGGIVASRKEVTRMVCRCADGKSVTRSRLVTGWRRELLAPVYNEWSAKQGVELIELEK